MAENPPGSLKRIDKIVHGIALKSTTQGSSQSLATLGFDKNAFGVQGIITAETQYIPSGASIATTTWNSGVFQQQSHPYESNS
jgi:hypothetical protein